MTTEEEIALANRARFVLNDEQWPQFIEMLNRTVTENPALHRLLTEPSVLENNERK